MNKKYQYLLRLQRRYRNLQKRWAATQDRKLAHKLDMIKRRLHRLNRKWSLGISAAALTLWLAAMPTGTVQAQRSYASLSTSAITTETGFKIFGEAGGDDAGFSVSKAGDINADGIEDLVIGARDANGSTGAAYVIFGATEGFPGLDTLELSSLDGTNGFKILGENSNDDAGRSVSPAGDVNGDGIDDLLIGADEADPNENNSSGITYVVFGADQGFDATLELATLSGEDGFKIFGEADNDDAGHAVSSAGDLNGDGIGDVLIGAPFADINGSRSGTAYVVFGSDTNLPDTLQLSDLDGSNGFKLFGEFSDQRAGYAVSSIGDVNGDGMDDVMIGAPAMFSGESGSAYIVFGDAEGFEPSIALSSLGDKGVKLMLGEAYDGIGASVSNAGDLNGDGFDDIVIGTKESAYYTGYTGAGSSYVVFGSQDGLGASTIDLSTLDGTDGFQLQGETLGTYYNELKVSSAGDVNGDGIDDLLIGEPYNDNGVDFSYSGAAYVVFGSDESTFPATLDLGALDGINGFQIFSEIGGDNFGRGISSAGDVNHDGFDDLLIGAPFADPNGNASAGITYIIYGGETAPVVLSNALTDAVATEAEAFTYPLEEAFISRDGEALSLSATMADGSELPSWLSLDSENAALSGTPGSVDVGVVLSIEVTATDGEFSLSDVFELTVNSQFLDVIPSEVSGLDGSNGFKIIGENSYDDAGRSVSNAGDINGDGIDDLLIGAPFADPNGNYSAGITYVVFGADQGFDAKLELAALDGNNGFKILGEAGSDNSGVSVSAAGDINGDGIDDLLIGADEADPNGVGSAGITYVVFGADQGFDATLELSALDGTNGFKLVGEAEFDDAGYSVSNAGDVNGDGLDDLLIGALFADPNGTSSGMSYVVFGATDGFDAVFELSSLDGSNGFKIAGEKEFDEAGIEVSAAGDFNGDGISDILIATDETNDALAYLILGTDTEVFPATLELSTLDGSNGFKIVGDDSAIRRVSNVGDVNGDGFDDLILGIPFADPNGASSGTARVIFGFAGDFEPTLSFDVDGSNGFQLIGEVSDNRVGAAVSGAGDFNGDGIDDVLIGADGADGSQPDAGAAFIIFGTTAGFPESLNYSELNGVNGHRLLGERANDDFGLSVSYAGDINADGIDDIVIGAREADPDEKTSAGVTYVLFGRANKPPVLAIALPDVEALEGEALSYEVDPVTTFIDPEGLALTLSATLADGSPLPDWLSFDPDTGLFSGTPGTDDIGDYAILVTATDLSGLSVSDEFEIAVSAAADDDDGDDSGDDGNGDDSGDDGSGDGETPLSVGDAEVPSLVFYPNPTQGVLTLESEQPVVAHLTDMHGRTLSAQLTGTVLTFDMSGLKSGVYFLVIAEGTEVHTHKIVKQ